MNLTLKERLDLQKTAKIITESQYNKLLKEVVEIPSWLEGKLKDVHTKAGQGSIFAKPLDYVLKQAQDALDKSSDLDKIANGSGTLTIKSPGIGYNLVLPIEKAKQLPNAQMSETEKVEGPNKINVPLVKTSAATDEFKTDELTIIVRPKKDEAGNVLPGEYIVLSIFPGDPDIPRASEWNGKYAVIMPDAGKYISENIYYHNGQDFKSGQLYNIGGQEYKLEPRGDEFKLVLAESKFKKINKTKLTLKERLDLQRTARIITESQYNKLLKEGTIQLTSDERRQVDDMLPKIINIIAGNYLGDNRQREVGEFNGISADKSPIKVKIFVGNDMSEKNANGYYKTKDKKNPNDNIIMIQQFQYTKYFKGFGGLDTDFTKMMTGNENPGIDSLRKTLTHELIHAKDPALNHQFLKEPYDHRDEVYYKSWTEFQTMTGQFFEAITTSVDRAVKLKMTKEEILSALDSILQFYSGKQTTFNQNAKDFIQGSGKRTAFQSLVNKFTQYSSSLDTYASYILMIKKYNPGGYKEFLTDLYKTVDDAKDKTKKLI